MRKGLHLGGAGALRFRLPTDSFTASDARGSDRSPAVREGPVWYIEGAF